jgi:hypothetical protein
MLHPASGVIEKKVAESLWDSIRKWFNRNRDLKRQVEALRAELAEERSGRLAFEQLRSELECRPGDDPMYWRKDGTDGPFCHLCLDDGHKLIRLINGNGEGSYYCSLHKEYFETAERRERNRQPVPVSRPRRYRPSGPWS